MGRRGGPKWASGKGGAAKPGGAKRCRSPNQGPPDRPMGRVSAAGRRGPTRPARARAAVACRGAPTPPPQMRPRAPAGRSVCRRGARAQWAGAAAGQQVGAPRPPPPAAALARRAEAPGEEGARAARRGGGGGAGGGGPARTATCLLQAASGPSRAVAGPRCRRGPGQQSHAGARLHARVHAQGAGTAGGQQVRSGIIKRPSAGFGGDSRRNSCCAPSANRCWCRPRNILSKNLSRRHWSLLFFFLSIILLFAPMPVLQQKEVK